MNTDNVSSENNSTGRLNTEKVGPQKSAASYSKKVLLLIVSAASLIFLLVILMTYFERANLIIDNTQDDYETIDTIDELQMVLLRIEAEFSNFILTGEVDQIEVFEGDINSVTSELETLHQKWQGFITRSDIVELKTDINQVVDKLQRVISSEDRSAATQKTAVNTAKQAIQEVRDELRDIRTSLVAGTKSKHADNVKQVERIKWTMVSLSAISFSLILFLFSMTLKNDQLHRELASSMTNKHQELEAMVEDRTRDLMGLASYLTRVNENERSRIARELHDELGALLTAANMDSAWIARNLKDEDKGKFSSRLTRLSENLKRGIALKRQITTSLVPPLLRELGLQEALDDMISEVKALAPETNISLSFIGELPKLDPEQELALYRICQESLTNISKYAKATDVQVVLSIEEDSISMDIEDNGVGFDTANRRTGTHGIVSLRSRAAMFEGTLNVSSTINKGTKVSTSMKLKKISNEGQATT
jgi:protein-histidine pros-kinase